MHEHRHAMSWLLWRAWRHLLCFLGSQNAYVTPASKSFNATLPRLLQPPHPPNLETPCARRQSRRPRPEHSSRPRSNGNDAPRRRQPPRRHGRRDEHPDVDTAKVGGRATQPGVPAHAARAARARAVPPDPRLRDRLLGAVPADARRAVRRRRAGPRAGRRAELLCAQGQRLQRLLREARMGVDDAGLCPVPAHAPERRRRPRPHAEAAARRRALGGRDGLVVPRDAVVLRRAHRRPWLPLDGRQVRARGAGDGEGGRGRRRDAHGGGVQGGRRPVGGRARHLGARLPAGARHRVPDARGGLAGAAVERRPARGAVRRHAGRGAQERRRRGRDARGTGRGQVRAGGRGEDGAGGDGAEPVDAADDGHLLPHVVRKAYGARDGHGGSVCGVRRAPVRAGAEAHRGIAGDIDGNTGLHRRGSDEALIPGLSTTGHGEPAPGLQYSNWQQWSSKQASDTAAHGPLPPMTSSGRLTTSLSSHIVQPPSEADLTIMSRVRAPVNLPELVTTAFAKARLDGELHYFPTQVTTLRVGSIPFQLRFSPALANKPRGPPPDARSPRPHQPADPFADPPPGLFIADLGPAHYLVLNKFAVVPEHFILATRAFRPQTHVLEAADLDAARACLGAYEAAGGGALFAFFNCGQHSGASQPHRHIQLLPVARMRDGLDAGGAWHVLAERRDLDEAPFVTFSETIGTGMPSADLRAAYLRLYRRACRAVAAHAGARPADEEAPAEGEARISYNMAMTSGTLVVCPRLAEGGAVLRRGEAVGRLALNGTVLAGTALVKGEAEWEALRGDPRALADALRLIGVPREGFDEGTEL
ncbi:Uncharacterized protein TCAP_07057 [Tolypocladium capitatum]|uniref:Uncharacterized protein n=1 Tax=Tolypocladium capitatum TaxID=45235 RepID=A0A2K3Q5L2_9HYPO|nr:Uncharacterized protein TCAP_07057 [Tolypocladium capitatum]